MSHLRETILARVETLCKGTATAGSKVTRDLEYDQKIKESSINIVQGADTPVSNLSEEAVLPFIDRNLEIGIEIRGRVEGDLEENPVGTLVNTIAREISVAFHADPTLGVTGVYDIDEGTTSALQTDGSGSKRAGLITMDWSISYRTSRTDPGA